MEEKLLIKKLMKIIKILLMNGKKMYKFIKIVY